LPSSPLLQTPYWEEIRLALIRYLTWLIAAHSMEEAEALCDRLGIFVNGELQCIGNAKEVNV